jgi:hypothetical protein
VGCETTIPAGDRPQNFTIYCAAIVIGNNIRNGIDEWKRRLLKIAICIEGVNITMT